MARLDLNEIAARNIRVLRNELGWSQEALAARCGLHRTYVGAIERGERNITLNTLHRISTALKIKPAELLKKAP